MQAELLGVEEHVVEVGVGLQRLERGLLEPDGLLGAVGRREQALLLGPQRGLGLVGRAAGSSAWSRSSSIVAAWLRMTGTEGRKTDAVSPRRRARTKRPTAWAKNSGVEVDVA